METIIDNAEFGGTYYKLTFQNVYLKLKKKTDYLFKATNK